MASVRRIRPPVPAPYLTTIPSAAELRSSPDMVEAARVIQRLRQLIREAREAWEAENGVEIVPEQAGIPTMKTLLAELTQTALDLHQEAGEE